MCGVCHIESMGFPMNRWWWWRWWRWWHVCVPSWLINIILDSNATIHSVRRLYRYSPPICLSEFLRVFRVCFYVFLLLFPSFTTFFWYCPVCAVVATAVAAVVVFGSRVYLGLFVCIRCCVYSARQSQCTHWRYATITKYHGLLCLTWT